MKAVAEKRSSSKEKSRVRQKNYYYVSSIKSHRTEMYKFTTYKVSITLIEKPDGYTAGRENYTPISSRKCLQLISTRAKKKKTQHNNKNANKSNNG